MKKIDGRTVEGRMLKAKASLGEIQVKTEELQAKYEELRIKNEELRSNYEGMEVRHERMLSEVKLLQRLLASFNAISRNDHVRLQKLDKGTVYYYLRAMPVTDGFEIVQSTWIDGRSDHYRYAMGNMYLDAKMVKEAQYHMDRMLKEL